MKEETKQMIQVHLGMLSTTLKSENVVAGIMVNKLDFSKSTLAFVDYDSYVNGNSKDGFTVSLDEINKGFLAPDK